jgi:hypothetical protein
MIIAWLQYHPLLGEIMFGIPFLRALKLTVAACAVASQAAFAAPVTFNGDLSAADAVFNRPFTLFSLSGVGTATSYDIFGFHVDAAGVYSAESMAFSALGADTFLALYAGAFDPSAPLTNLLTLDDDSGTGALSLLSATLQAGIQYYLIFTSYDNGDFGNYTGTLNTVTGGGQITLDDASADVPEPATLGLLGLSLLGMHLVRRRYANTQSAQ